MARIVQLDLNPDRRTLRQFGVIALVAFGVLSVCAQRELWLFSGGLGAARTTVAAVLGFVALGSGLCSALHPSGNRALYVSLAVLSFPIGFVMSYVVLGVLFFGIFAPVGLLLRVLGKDPMHRTFERDRPSYWSDARPKRDNASYFRQF